MTWLSIYVESASLQSGIVLQSACCCLSMGGDSRLVCENVSAAQSCVASDNVGSTRSYSIAAAALTSAGWARASLSLWEERAAAAWRAAVTDNGSQGVSVGRISGKSYLEKPLVFLSQLYRFAPRRGRLISAACPNGCECEREAGASERSICLWASGGDCPFEDWSQESVPTE